jgi:hypothetical protein
MRKQTPTLANYNYYLYIKEMITHVSRPSNRGGQAEMGMGGKQGNFRMNHLLGGLHAAGKERRMWNPSALHACVPHEVDTWNKGLNHLYGTFVSGADSKPKTKVPKR